MKKNVILPLVLMLCTVVMPTLAQTETGNPRRAHKGWRLVWAEEFDSNELDTTSWSRCKAGGADWMRHMSPLDSLCRVEDGTLRLYGIRTPEGLDDDRPCITGGVDSKGKRSLRGPARIDVRARFDCAQGFWPAIWLMPDSDIGWPRGGEIDIMEHLNFDDIAYQTVHTPVTLRGGNRFPPNSGTAPIDPNAFNTYSVIFTDSKIQFLINDRPIWGGCNSSETRVHLGGHIEMEPYTNLGNMIKEFGPLRGGNAQPAEFYEDDKKRAFLEAESENLDLYPSYRVEKVDCRDGHINAVYATHIETGETVEFRAPIFSDCTGDGTVGYLAGADYSMGRESRAEYNEPSAPEQGDSLTMGASVQWYSVEDDAPSSFPLFEYGLNFNDQSCERVTMGEWTWETGMNLDQIRDAERIRDYGLMVVYSNWSYLKNHKKDNDRWADRDLEWVAYIAGKRESRRLLGDYILKQDDIDKNVFHEDASFTTTWSIDLHFPDPENSRKFPGAEFKTATVHNWIYPYAVPYRCLYSRNIDNLFMAGRNISQTHVALGTTRVMRTTGMMGEVVGMAASLCHKYSCSPRDVYRYHLDELKPLMKKGAGKYEGTKESQRFNLPNELLEKPKAFIQNEPEQTKEK